MSSNPYTKEMQLKQNKKPRQKRCKECNKLFTPVRELQPCCSFECDINHVDSNLKGLVALGGDMRTKRANKRKAEFKDNDKKTLLIRATKVVNEYIRLRDKGKPCISCGHMGDRKINAGHFRPAGANQQLRFYTLNIFLQCEQCNTYLAANLVPYRINLIAKLGIEKVEEMEANHTTKKYTVEYLQKLIKVFRKKIKLYEGKFR